MSKSTVNPLALGALLRPSPTLDHAVRFLDSVGGTDKMLMFIQYSSQIITWGFSRLGKTALAERVARLNAPVSDFRILLRYYGLLPLIQWMIHIEHHPPATSRLLNIARIQNLTMLIYYPLEHVWWLAHHNIIPLSEVKKSKIGLWSCRFWAAYVMLQFWNLTEQWGVVKRKERELIKKVDENEMAITREQTTIQAERRRIVNEAIANFGYLPMTIHWSMEHSRLPEVAIGVLGAIASISQIIGAWKATS